MCVMLNQLFARNWVTLHELAVFSGLIIYAVASHTFRQRRHPSAAIAWVISLVLLPYITLPLYLMFGSRKVVRYGAGVKTQTLIGATTPGTPPTTAAQIAFAMGI